ncbi:hypothetical protein KY348_02455 [Candidatus Woesearchaeota archaeon]|nr:hypothetical protein [Candidatus Woesearchaeota archaeon]
MLTDFLKNKERTKIEKAFRQGNTFSLQKTFQDFCKEMKFQKEMIYYQRIKNTEPKTAYDPENNIITLTFGYYYNPYEELLFSYEGGPVDVMQFYKNPELDHIKYQNSDNDNLLLMKISENAKNQRACIKIPDQYIFHTKIHTHELAPSLTALVKHSDQAAELIARYVLEKS